MIIQKIREAECNAVFDEYVAKKGDLVTAPCSASRAGRPSSTSARPRPSCRASEQIPGETHHVGERIKAVILDVRKVGHRVKIILSRTHPDFVRRLFENEIPEIADRTIEIKALAREAGYRSKVAVSSIDMKVDCVGACVGVRGSRIKNIVDELGGERIDIVRWNDSLQVMIPNALQPAADRGGVPLSRGWAGPSCWSRKISCRWPSAGAARTSGWPRSWSAGTSRS